MDDQRWKLVISYVIHEIRASVKESEWAVLFVDGYGAHLKNSEALLVELYQHRILLYVYAPNLTAYVAPPDTKHWHGLFKKSLRDHLWSHGGSSSRSDFLSTAAHGLRPLTPDKAKAAFDYVGISPDPRVRMAAKQRLLSELAPKVTATQQIFRVVEQHPRAAKLLRVRNMVVLSERREQKREQKRSRTLSSGLPRIGAVNDKKVIPLLKRQLSSEASPSKRPAGEDPAPPASGPDPAPTPKPPPSHPKPSRLKGVAKHVGKSVGPMHKRLRRLIAAGGSSVHRRRPRHRRAMALQPLPPSVNPYSRDAWEW